MRVPRVAYLPDSFHEVNGVAHTSRNFVAYARRRELPFLCVRAGARAQAFEQTGELRTLELKRSRGSVRMEKILSSIRCSGDMKRRYVLRWSGFGRT